MSELDSALYTYTTYEHFADIPLDEKNRFCYIHYTDGTDPDAPSTAEYADWVWNVISFGASTRKTQLAFSPYRNRNILYMRQRHDDNWHGWYPLYITGDTIGSSSTPIYLNNGVPTACTSMTTRQFIFTASISANSKYYSNSLDVSYSGHTPIGIIGITLDANNANVAPIEWNVSSSGVLTLGLMNNTSSAQSVTIYVTVLYM